LACDFEVLTKDVSTIPEDGVLVQGLYLEGARWNLATKLLAESHQKVLYDPLPIIWFKPVRLILRRNRRILVQYTKLVPEEVYCLLPGIQQTLSLLFDCQQISLKSTGY
jgi:hypothetical protein